MKTILFAYHFDAPNQYLRDCTFEGFGETSFLNLLEKNHQLEPIEITKDLQFARTENFRQSLQQYLIEKPAAFFADSFEADTFGTARKVISILDELTLNGWDFGLAEDLPPRLLALSELNRLEQNIEIPNFAAQFIHLFKTVEESDFEYDFDEILLVEPQHFLPTHWQRLFRLLEKKGVKLGQLERPKSNEKANNLQKIKNKLLNVTEKVENNFSTDCDSSVIVLKALRESDAAEYVAQILKKNSFWKPVCLIPEENRMLEEALVKVGLPNLGIQSQSGARPSLQVLKLLTVFLWEPLDISKVMEFLSLAIQPLHSDLASKLAVALAENPGVGSDKWRAVLAIFFEENESQNADELKKEYRFWFERRRTDNRRTVQTSEPIELFAMLSKWARRTFDEQNNKNMSLLVLSNQARRVADLLDLLSEKQIGYLDLERIVRSVSEPTPVQMREPSPGHLDFVHQPEAIISEVNTLLWWNFVGGEPSNFFNFWYPKEIDYLKNLGVEIQLAAVKNRFQMWKYRQAVLNTEHQLVLFSPENVMAEKTVQHVLWADFEFGLGKNLQACEYNIHEESDRLRLEKIFVQANYQKITRKHDAEAKVFLEIKPRKMLSQYEKETLTSLENLLYFPHQWLLKYRAKLQKSPILSIIDEKRLYGNLSHKLIEKLFLEKNYPREEGALRTWIEKEIGQFLAREGAVLLQYGMEPQRISFVNKLKKSILVLVSAIDSNGWEVVNSEFVLDGFLHGRMLETRVDLILRRDDDFAIIDLKWGGKTYQSDLIRNEEDVQLAVYAGLWRNSTTCKTVHTAYFILESGQLLARNKLGFSQAVELSKDKNHDEVHERMMDKIAATYSWRQNQIETGKIEIRTSHNIKELEKIYEDGLLLDLLEMKRSESKFDDYKILVNENF